MDKTDWALRALCDNDGEILERGWLGLPVVDGVSMLPMIGDALCFDDVEFVVQSRVFDFDKLIIILNAKAL